MPGVSSADARGPLPELNRIDHTYASGDDGLKWLAARSLQSGLVVPSCRGLDFGYSAVKDADMAPEATSAGKSGQESVVLASFDSYRRAEQMLASLGRRFRVKARTGGTTAVVIRGNPDGSLKVTESRVLTAGVFVAAVMRVSLAWMVGFMGLLGALTGAKGGVHAARMRKGHVGSLTHRAHELLAEAGPDAALVLVRCEDQATRQLVATAATDRARDSWDGSLTEFLAALDPGSEDDWVRNVIGEPPSPNR